MISKEASVSMTEGTLINTNTLFNIAGQDLTPFASQRFTLVLLVVSRQQMLPLSKCFSLTLDGDSRLTGFVAPPPLTEGVDPFGDKA